MAKELETLKSRRPEDSTQGSTEPSSVPVSFQDSPDRPIEHPGRAVVDENEPMQDQFGLEGTFSGRDRIIEVFKM
jgi:hypothetical protein